MSELSQRLANLSPEKRRLLEQRLKQQPTVAEPIAIIGMGCRLPGAENLAAYWRLLADGVDATGEIPADRWDVDALYDPDPDVPGRMSTRWGGFVGNPRLFDPGFFGITPREASKIDPQQRLVLEVAWEALEHGCVAPERLAGSNAGVFVGIGTTDYSKLPSQYNNHLEHIDAYGGTGNALSIAANRLSYLLDLRGPSLIVDTACSSALVAIHLAVSALRSRECDAALAGGVNMILSPETTIAFSSARMLSPDGHCRPFDAGANGYVRGEGCGMIVLKRLTDAAAAGDRVLAVIRGTAVNSDGRTSGITAPNANSQQTVIRAALAAAGIGPERVSYIEAHGTGTPLGDPIEIQALGKIFRRASADDPPVYVSSSKGNIGHLETAAGAAALIKAVLLLQHRQILPQLHLEKLNPNIALTGTRLQIPKEAVPWTPAGKTRIAGVSSFGFGGTNAHVVLEEAAPAADAPTDAASDRPLHLLALSAKTDSALTTLVGAYVDYLDGHPEAGPADVAFSANAGRSHFNRRITAVAATRDELRERLAAWREGRPTQGVKAGQVKIVTRPKVAMLFTGQGAQYAGMGRRLFETQPVFREALAQCDAILRPHLPEPLLAVLYGEAGGLIHETVYTQTALFAVEYALATLWRSWGVEPDAMLGHSVGEYVAAAVAGVFTFEDGLTLVAHRARLMQALPAGGRMAVIFAPEQRVAEAIAPLADRVSIAAANGPENTVVSGEAEAVCRIVAQFEAAGVGTRALQVSHAFHSPLMEPMLDEFERLAGAIQYQRPRVPIVSNVTGEVLYEAPPDAAYWRAHVRQCVRFAAGMERLNAEQVHAILEVGPAPVLAGMGRHVLADSAHLWLPSLRAGQDDWTVMLDSLGALYRLGVRIDWAGFDKPWERRRLALPTYPFERVPLWFDDARGGQKRTLTGEAATSARGPAVHPLLGHQIPAALATTLFEARLSSHAPRYLIDHQVQGSPVTPAAVYVELALAAAEQGFGPGEHVVENVAIQQAMFLGEGGSRTLQTALAAETGGERTFEVYSAPAEGSPRWALHACGRLRAAAGADTEPRRLDLDSLRSRMEHAGTSQQFYAQMAERGMAYGPAFRVLDDVRRSERDGVAEVRLPPEIAKELSRYRVHPVLLDACFQSMAGAVPLTEDGSDRGAAYMPVYIRQVRMHAPPTERMFTYAARTSAPADRRADTVEGDVLLVDGDGRVLVELLGIRVQRVGRAAAKSPTATSANWLYRLDWQEQPLTQAAARPPQGTWIVLADGAGVADRLVARLQQHGARAVLVRPAEAFGRVDNGQPGAAETYGLRPLAGDEYRMLLDAVLGAEASCAGVIHLWSLDLAPPGDAVEAELEATRRLGPASVLQLVQQLARYRFTKAPELWLVTRGGQAIGSDAPLVPGAATVWGMGRVAAIEHPEMRCRLVDLDPSGSAESAADALAAELSAGSGEDQIAWRGRERRVARLVPDAELLTGEGPRAGQALAVPRHGPFRLRLKEAGSFDALWYEPFTRPAPGAGQVEIEVRAAGLNFSDVLKAMGLYPGITDEIVPLGIECSGRVTAVGAGVERFRVGDEVMGIAPYAFASHALTAEYAIVPRPAQLSDAEACTIPVTFLTAYYGLVHLARLQPGERVLIHAAAGGVGLAAIQIARAIGAEIFATAGSESKRDYLRTLGVEHVYSSRSLDFADEILAQTGREGVDVVLNSLPGEAITKSLAILRAYGRFLEIGKTDIYQNRMIGLLPFQDNLSYFAIDLDRMLRQRPAQIRALFAEVMEHFAAGRYRALAHTEFAADETLDAFRYMAQRKNTGKVVVSLVRPADESGEESAETVVRPEGTYLLTGGLGALGLRVAEWLAGQGARHLVLLARREPDERAARVIERLRAAGVKVAAVQGDVTRLESLSAALAEIPAAFPPLRGVVHAAGALADGVLFDMNLRRLDKALKPKVDGAWNVHRATRDAALDFFVMFSSVAGLIGSPGQGNYAAGNAFLDAFAQWRRSRGLPAMSIAWGPWADAGMAAEAGRGEQIAARGMGLIEPEQGLEILGKLLRARPASAAVFDAHWSDLLRMMRGRRPPLLACVAAEADETTAAAKDKVDHAFLAGMAELGPAARQAKLQDYFARELARIMGTNPAALDVSVPLSALGLDSLMAIELKNNLEARLMLNLPMSRFLEGPSVAGLAETAAGLLAGGAQGEAAGAAQARQGAAGGVQSSTWTPLVALAGSGAAPALFCVHPVGGDIRCYVDFAKALGGSRPVYGLRARGIEGGLPPHDSMDAMVNDYLAAIRRIQPAGPYHLAGWSTGGIYAYEMARRLHDAGETMGPLLLFDAPMPEILRHVDLDDDARFLFDVVNFSNYFAGAGMRVSYEELRAQGPEERLATVLSQAKEHRVVAAEAGPEHLRRLIDVCRANVRLIMEYTLAPFPQAVRFFHPTQRGVLAEAAGQTHVTADHGWSEVPGVALALEEVPGDHFSMMTGLFAQQLAARVAACLAEASPAPAAKE